MDHLAEEIGHQMPVKIHLKTTITQDRENEKYELMLLGEYYQKGDAAFFEI